MTAPSCGSGSGTSSKRTIGYYESWSYTRSCDAWEPSDIDASKWTHLNYAFALIDDATYEMAQMNDFDTTLYPKFTDLKGTNAALKVFISVGGWDAGGAVFSAMTSTAANRAAFIASAKKFLKTYAFDGIDIDWEYPVADDRGGTAADKANFVTFLAELREALGDDYGITATLPSSYWYMQHFDLVGMEPYLDWFNIMTYDIHGTWDGNNPYTSAVVQAHTNLTEIDTALNLLWRNDIDSSKVVLGLGFYGRSFTLADGSSCTKPGCAFSDGGNPGECTANSGTLSYAEIQDIISNNDLSPVLDEDAAVKYITWDSDQWVSYDDADTFELKLAYANKKCLGGTMAWALDLDTTGTSGSNSAIDALQVGSSVASGLSLQDTKNTLSLKSTLKRTNTLSLGLFWTACLPPGSQSCPSGYKPVVYGHGKVFDADLNHISGEGCHGGGRSGFNRVLCAENSMKFSCQWGPGKTSKACNSKCPNNYLTLTKNSHVAGQDSGCKSGKYAPVCCDYLYAYHSSDDTCSSSYMSQQLSGGLGLSLTTSNARSYDYSGGDDDSEALSKHRKLKAKRAATKEKSELKARQETSTVSNELMALSPAPQKRVVDTGAACGDALAADQIGLDVPAVLISYTIGGTSYYSFSATATNTKASSTTKKKPTKTVHESTRVSIYQTEARTCLGGTYPQPCMHYSSVIKNNARYSLLTCSDNDHSVENRPIVDAYNKQHHTDWVKKWIASSYTNPKDKKTTLRPQRDEWPPNHFNQGVNDGYIRLLPSEQNSGAANKSPKQNGWKGFCKFPPDKDVKVEGGPIEDKGDSYEVTIMTSTIVTLPVMSYTWSGISEPAGDPAGIENNKCWPSVLTNDPGFALLTNDPYYNGWGGVRGYAYKWAPEHAVTVGKSQPKFKRDADGQGDDDFVWDPESRVLLANDGNSTRLATEEEIREILGMKKCATPDCAAELEVVSAYEAQLGLPTHPVVPAASSLTNVYVESETTREPSLPVVTAGVAAAASKPSAPVFMGQPTATPASS